MNFLVKASISKPFLEKRCKLRSHIQISEVQNTKGQLVLDSPLEYLIVHTGNQCKKSSANKWLIENRSSKTSIRSFSLAATR